MKKIIISNCIVNYLQGKCDGIIFKSITDEDAEALERIASKYGKETRISEVSVVEETKETDESEMITDKRKIKKIFVNNGIKTIKILPEQMTEYLSHQMF